MSLSIILFNEQKNLFNLSFLDDCSVKTSIVCPNPQVADSLGSLKSVKENENITAMTVSKFTGDILKPISEVPQTRKSEIYLELGAVFKKKFSHYPDNYFDQAFNILTEFRGYTTNAELIEEIFEEVDEEIVQIIKLFWAYMDVRPLIDEHKTLSIITDFLRESEHEFIEEIPREEQVIFWGFSHVSSAQVDFIKALSIFNDVYIPFYEELYEKATLSDWIKWLETGNSKVEKIEESEAQEANFQSIYYSKGRLTEAVKNLPEQWNDIEHVFLGQQNPSAGQYLEIPLDGFSFRIDQNLVDEKLSQISEEIEKKITTSETDSLLVEEMASYLEQLKSDSILNSDFRMVKAIELFENAFSRWADLSDFIEDVNFFDLKIISEVSELNSPRNYLMPLLKTETKKSISGLKELSSFNASNKTLFVLNSDYDKVKAGGKVYSEESLKSLASIGPIRNTEMEFLILSNQIKEIWNSEKTLILIEKGLLDSSLEWSSVVDKFQKEEVVASNNKIEKTPQVDVLKDLTPESLPQVTKLSASRLQNFIDCPRKYLFSNILKWDFPSVRPEALEPRILGELEHLVVQKYLEQYNDWDKSAFEAVTKKELDHYLEKHGKSLNEEEYLECKYEIENHSRNGISELLKLKEIDPEVTFTFEVELKGESVTGRVDCIISGPKLGNLLIDFKRGSSSIPDKNELKSFRKIQVWYYLNFLNKMDRWKIWGYLCLADPEESLFFTDEKGVKELFTSVDFCPDATYEVIKESLDEKLGAFEELFQEQFLKLKNEKVFAPTPIDNKACQYCVVENLCPRGVEK
tara:strand:- start:178499 stop:180913 length:2415 start_codon:yes stop_codon:yes gene_type:complete